MLKNPVDRRYSTNPESVSGRLKRKRARSGISRRLSAADTLSLDSSPRLRDDPRSYVTKRLDEYQKRVRFEDLEASDSLTIHTEYSRYSFLVLDPVDRVGILTGGRLRRAMTRATLVGMIEEGDESRRDESCLRAGAQALFVIRSGKEVRRITTSVITAIVHESVADRVSDDERKNY
jgi:hypothetical protein